MTELVLGVDVSKWQNPSAVPYQYLYDNGFKFGIAKLSMGGGIDTYGASHVNAMKAAGMDSGGYHWCDPTQDWERQAGFFISQAKTLRPKILMLDVEQWWSSWTKYNQYLRGEISSSQVPRLSGSEVVANLIDVANRVIEANLVPKKRIIVYTARWFSNIYPELGPAISSLGLGIAPAHYRTNISGVTWLQKEYPWDEFYSLVPVNQRPLMPVGGPEDYTIWQFTSAPKFQGVRLDCNLFNGTLADYDAWMDRVIPIPDPDPEPPEWEQAYQELLQKYAVIKENVDKILQWARSINFDG